MKKIGSYVLMAVMMLIGTVSLQAKTWSVDNDLVTFADAWEGAGDGDVIRLTKKVDVNATLWLGTDEMNATSRSLEIDLNGYDLTITAANGIMITHGKLKITNSNPAAGKLIGGTGCKNIFYLTGSTNKDVDPSMDGVNYYTHLEIAEGVIVAQTTYGTAIGVFELNSGSAAQKKIDDAIPSKPALKYITNVYATKATSASKAVAHGVRVDLKGTINGTKYGIKTNGNLGSPTASLKAGHTSVQFTTTSWPNLTGYTIAATDVDYSPYIHVHPTGRITVKPEVSATDGNPVGVYASGYARWTVEGYAEGCNGAVVKSGDVDFHDATIKGTGTTYAGAVETNSGNDCSGSAIVVASSANYSGDMKVTISGDSQISAEKGYAVDEAVVAASGETKVEVITISGGSFQGGTVPNPDPKVGGTIQGTIKISGETVGDENAEVEITAGVVINSENPDESVMIGDETLTEFLGDDMHVTTTVDGNNNPVVVINNGAQTGCKANITSLAGQVVNWGHTSSLDDSPMYDEISADLTLASLEITRDYNQTLAVKDGKTLTVGSVTLGQKAQIIVEAGATLIVTDINGIYAPLRSNILLKTQAGKPSIFLFNPAVDGNSHPKATVEFRSTKSFAESASNYQWERFGLPTWSTIESIECNNATLVTNIQVFGASGWSNLGNLTGSTFANMSKLNKPFIACALLANTGSASPANATYSFGGALTGNSDVKLNSFVEWTPFANSYSANVDVAALLAGLSGAVNIDKAIYLGTHVGNGRYNWDPVTVDWMEDGKKLAPMEAFIIRNRGTVAEEATLDYADMVWAPATSSSPAPRRGVAVNNNTAKLRIVVENAEGEWDNVKLAESENNSRCAVKYMNEKMNLYAHAQDSKLAIVGAEDLEGTYFGFETEEGGEFTIRFADVQGREFELIDLQTDAVVKVEEGNTYTFEAAANSTNDYRFKLVSAKRVATSVDNLSNDKKADGIYTVLGQYVGEMNLWNSLPAGIYVVNGEKVAK